MGQVTVDPDDLDRTARRLQRAGERLGGISRQLARTGPAAIGDPGLASALDDFGEHWKHGLRQLGEAADVTGAQLAEAASAYRLVDRAVAEACR
ncbi:MAG TPA: hypothetical protein VM433_04600 [Mycobacteriales bacterium]|nr:hypothetical protein [Mycobacteriales bacterium]